RRSPRRGRGAAEETAGAVAGPDRRISSASSRPDASNGKGQANGLGSRGLTRTWPGFGRPTALHPDGRSLHTPNGSSTRPDGAGGPPPFAQYAEPKTAASDPRSPPSRPRRVSQSESGSSRAPRPTGRIDRAPASASEPAMRMSAPSQ